jgi:hypothetical protein
LKHIVAGGSKRIAIIAMTRPDTDNCVMTRVMI